MEDRALPSFHGIIGRSAPMRALFGKVERLAPYDFPVLVRGEPGTETELVARAVHRLSPYRRRGFRIVRADDRGEPCIGDRLLLRQLVVPAGPSSPARRRLWGMARGTLVLGEITELSAGAQADVVRFLDRSPLDPGRRGSRASIRVIATSRHDPDAAAEAGILRPGLCYNLFGTLLEVPPLRDRSADLPLLVEHLRQAINRRFGLAVSAVGRDAMAALRAHDWPGNLWDVY